ncbi:hypothetical protein [Streptomyces sp. NBC_01485]|uniref:hypothetical protein n=1 Tax=Streptomyces sp. NBC_01485 TaxID=2903884 RepID=UPI003FCCA546
MTSLGSQGVLIAAAFAVLKSGGDGGDVGLVAAARPLPLVLFLLIDQLARIPVLRCRLPPRATRNGLQYVTKQLEGRMALRRHRELLVDTHARPPHATSTSGS